MYLKGFVFLGFVLYGVDASPQRVGPFGGQVIKGKCIVKNSAQEPYGGCSDPSGVTNQPCNMVSFFMAFTPYYILSSFVKIEKPL